MKILETLKNSKILIEIWRKKTTNDKISEIYNDQTGFGSLANTFQDVKKNYPSITYKEVKDWYSKNAEYNVRSSGYNSFIASAPLQEFRLICLT